MSDENFYTEQRRECSSHDLIHFLACNPSSSQTTNLARIPDLTKFGNVRLLAQDLSSLGLNQCLRTLCEAVNLNIIAHNKECVVEVPGLLSQSRPIRKC